MAGRGLVEGLLFAVGVSRGAGVVFMVVDKRGEEAYWRLC